MKKIILALFILGGFAACKSKTKAITATKTPAASIAWLSETNLEQAKTQAIASGKSVFVDIGTDWCGYCKKMKRNIYTNNAVASAINAGFVPLSLDGERGDGRALVSKLGITGFPTQLILDSKGNVLKKNIGYLNIKQLLAFLK
jgi:thiol:disulfide interchange protein